jgi:hypothetical protein
MPVVFRPQVPVSCEVPTTIAQPRPFTVLAISSAGELAASRRRGGPLANIAQLDRRSDSPPDRGLCGFAPHKLLICFITEKLVGEIMDCFTQRYVKRHEPGLLLRPDSGVPGYGPAGNIGIAGCKFQAPQKGLKLIKV